MSVPPGAEIRIPLDGRIAVAWAILPPPSGRGAIEGRAAATPSGRVNEETSTTLVLLHSAGGNHHSYDSVLPYLSDIPVLVPALPGRCGSGGPHPGTASAAAAWVRALLVALEIPRAVVAGHSVGGAIAIEFALAQTSADSLPALEALALISTGARLRVRPEILRALEGAAARSSEPDLSFWLNPDPARALTPPASALADWKMADGFDRLDAVSSIRAQTLVFSGSEDPLAPPKYAAFLRDEIPGAELLSFEGAGHDLPLERPRELANALRSLVLRY